MQIGTDPVHTPDLNKEGRGRGGEGWRGGWVDVAGGGLVRTGHIFLCSEKLLHYLCQRDLV